MKVRFWLTPLALAFCLVAGCEKTEARDPDVASELKRAADAEQLLRMQHEAPTDAIGALNLAKHSLRVKGVERQLQAITEIESRKKPHVEGGRMVGADGELVQRAMQARLAITTAGDKARLEEAIDKAEKMIHEQSRKETELGAELRALKKAYRQTTSSGGLK